ncbi:MAG TPA: SGNH/GDSL hydrolase family protein, partial [Phycisphaerae bacterium]|nr:SGNH/GDSL hydrolase family protein [Phycisphaerae bacterium]
ILFGTNDVSYGPVPPDHTEMLAAVVDRCLADGTIPMLTTLPPRGDQKRSEHILNRVREIRRAQLAVARAKQIPLIDLYAEMLSRQPEEWDKILMGDTLHPSYRDPWKMDFTAEGLKNSGYTLRSYLTMMRWVEVIEKVIQPAPIAAAK